MIKQSTTPVEYSHDFHKELFTMSDLHKLFSLDSETPNLLLKFKTGERVRVFTPIVQNLLKWGKIYEGVTTNYFERYMNCGITYLESYSWDGVGGTVDGMLADISGLWDGYSGPAILEIKWRVYPEPSKAVLGSTKLKHYVQLQGYMGLLEKDYGILAECSLKEGMRLTLFTRDRNFWEEALVRMKQFNDVWRVNGTFPRRYPGEKTEDKAFVQQSYNDSFQALQLITEFPYYCPSGPDPNIDQSNK